MDLLFCNPNPSTVSLPAQVQKACNPNATARDASEVSGMSVTAFIVLYSPLLGTRLISDFLDLLM